MSSPRTPPMHPLSVVPIADTVPQISHSNSQRLSPPPLIREILKSHTTIQPRLLLHIKFGVGQPRAADYGAKGPNYKYLDSAGTNLPVFLSDIQTLTDLKSFQQEHLGNTYRYHGLSAVDVLCYSVRSLAPGEKGNYVKLLDCPTQARWNMAVRLVNTIYHEPSTCKSSGQCDFCATPPLLVICFTQEKWEQALKSKSLGNNSSNLVYLDGYNETHASKLRNADKTKYELYLKQCGLAYDQCKLIRLTSLCTPPPGHVAETSHQAVRLQAKQAPDGSPRRGRPPKAVTPSEAQGERIPIVPKRRGRPPKAGTSAKPPRKTPGTGKRGPRRLVVEDLPPTYKATAESYLKATLAPEGTEIKGHHCITCIHYNRKCKGDSMVLVESGRGKTAW